MAGYKKHYAPKPYDPNKKKWNPNWSKKPVVKEERKPILNPSKYQSDFFAAVKEGEHSIIVRACPGSGKTTSSSEAYYYQAPGLKTIYLAFNTDAARALEAKTAPGVEAKTNHSIGMRAVVKAFGKVDVDKNKDYRIAVSLVGDDEPKKAEEAYNISKAMDLAKSVLANTSEEVDDVIDRFGIEIPVHTDRKSFVANVLSGLEVAARQTNIISYGDMLWFVTKHNLGMVEQYDRIYQDELQDMSPSQQAIMVKLLAPGGKFYGVGDENQWLYGWAGSSEDGMDVMANMTSAVKMPLSICYRCGKKIVAQCATLVPEIEPWDKADDGIVDNATKQKMMTEAKPGDFIISRVNAPLVSLCLGFIREGRKAKIAGKDMGKSLYYFIKNSEATSLNELIDYTETWRLKEIERLSAKKRDFTHISDKADTILMFCENSNSLEQVNANISKMFDDDDDNNYIRLTSCHRAKGKEVDRVWALNNFKADESKAELNVAYVAWSRAKKELYLVDCK